MHNLETLTGRSLNSFVLRLGYPGGCLLPVLPARGGAGPRVRVWTGKGHPFTCAQAAPLQEAGSGPRVPGTLSWGAVALCWVTSAERDWCSQRSLWCLVPGEWGPQEALVVPTVWGWKGGSRRCNLLAHRAPAAATRPAVPQPRGAPPVSPPTARPLGARPACSLLGLWAQRRHELRQGRQLARWPELLALLHIPCFIGIPVVWLFDGRAPAYLLPLPAGHLWEGWAALPWCPAVACADIGAPSVSVGSTSLWPRQGWFVVAGLWVFVLVDSCVFLFLSFFFFREGGPFISSLRRRWQLMNVH